MTLTDLNRLKGNFAENVAASWLSQMCLIRPVAAGTDIGIDLYCEAILGSMPYLHFWAQVKAIQPSRVSSDEESASFDFETRHLEYWSNQPIPVYAFLVPIGKWPPKTPNRIYGVRITEYLVRYGIPRQSNKNIHATGYFDKETLATDLKQFIEEIVPWDTSANHMQRGIISPIATPIREEYRRYPSDIGIQHLPQVLENIRDASVMGLFQLLRYEISDKSIMPLRRAFESIATLFDMKKHDLGLSALVRAAYVDGKISRAQELVESGFKNILDESDVDTCTKRFRLQRLRYLLEDIDDAKNNF